MLNKGRILVVDDERRNVRLLIAQLSAAGYQTLAAYNGEDALRLAMSDNPDVILLDIMMPGLDGYEVTRRLKAKPATTHIPVVLVTSLDGSDNRVKGLDAGADEFLTKPVNRAELLVRVGALQRMKRMQDELQNRQQVARRMMHDASGAVVAKPRLLVVEDDVPLSRQIADVLRTQGFEPVLVVDAAGAREVMTQEPPPDLVLLDRLLPGCDGLQLMDEWKAEPAMVDIPVIIITALDDLEQKIEGIEHGADDYLTKPVEYTELLARVRASLRRAVTQRRLRQDVQRLQADTVTDQLTGVRNRHYLDVDLEYRVAQAVRDGGRNFSVLMVDLDYFKAVNDEFGHLVGDVILREVAQCLQHAARTADIVTRYGGEEFCVVLPEADQATAFVIAERLRQSVTERHYEGVGDLNITVSLGVASFCASDHGSRDLLLRADTALYEAKSKGRNQVCVAPSTEPGVVKGSL